MEKETRTKMAGIARWTNKYTSHVYRHGQPNPDSHSTMRVWIRLPMSVECLFF